MDSHVVAPPSHHANGHHYVERALDGELALVAAAPTGMRDTTLNRAAFRLGRLAGAGITTIDELYEPLLRAARGAGLPDAETHATITSGLRAGQSPGRGDDDCLTPLFRGNVALMR